MKIVALTVCALLCALLCAVAIVAAGCGFLPMSLLVAGILAFGYAGWRCACAADREVEQGW